MFAFLTRISSFPGVQAAFVVHRQLFRYIRSFLGVRTAGPAQRDGWPSSPDTLQRRCCCCCCLCAAAVAAVASGVRSVCMYWGAGAEDSVLLLRLAAGAQFLALGFRVYLVWVAFVCTHNMEGAHDALQRILRKCLCSIGPANAGQRQPRVHKNGMYSTTACTV